MKEYYITLGSGTTKSSVWEDVAGIESVIDTINYPSIKSIVFEVFLNIPTANGVAKAKLYNVTDKHDVWFSEVSSEGPSLTKKEASISLDRGANIPGDGFIFSQIRCEYSKRKNPYRDELI